MSSEDSSDLASVVPVIAEIRSLFVSEDDIDLVRQLRAELDKTKAHRSEVEAQSRAELKPLAVKLASARTSCQRPTNIPTPDVHAQTISKLDNRRFALVKAIEEGESILADREAEYNRLKAELKELEEKDAADEVELDGMAVRLNLYRELGFQWVEGKGSEPAQVLIRSETGEMHVLPLDGSLDDLDLRNRLWELNSS